MEAIVKRLMENKKLEKMTESENDLLANVKFEWRIKDSDDMEMHYYQPTNTSEFSGYEGYVSHLKSSPRYHASIEPASPWGHYKSKDEEYFSNMGDAEKWVEDRVAYFNSSAGMFKIKFKRGN